MTPRPHQPIRSSTACARPSPARIPGLPADINEPMQVHRAADGGHRHERNVAKALARGGLPERRKQSSAGAIADAGLWAVAEIGWARVA